MGESVGRVYIWWRFVAKTRVVTHQITIDTGLCLTSEHICNWDQTPRHTRSHIFIHYFVYNLLFKLGTYVQIFLFKKLDIHLFGLIKINPIHSTLLFIKNLFTNLFSNDMAISHTAYFRSLLIILIIIEPL